jgi:hypothetical protein
VTDIADKATDYQEKWNDRCIEQQRADIKPGEPGDCELCGEWSGRLIKGACAPCRDRYGLD